MRAVIIHSLHGMPEELWDKLPALELSANFGVGLERIDLGTAQKRGVRVSCTPDLLAQDVADLGMGLLLALWRRLVTGR